MKLTNGEIYNAREALEKLTQAKLPLRASYDLAVMATKLRNQLMVIEKIRLDLLQTYGDKDENRPNHLSIIPQSEKFPQFAEELGKLMTIEVDIDIEAVTLPDTLEIEPATLMALDKFIKVE